MEFTLALDPDDAARLPRLDALAAPRGARPRPQPLRVVWHDSPERALADQGLSLAEWPWGWRLERLDPDAGTWPPLVEEADERALFAHKLPSPLAPVAAFEGHRTVFTLTVSGEPLTLAMLSGVLRAVTQERPVCRLHLSGAEAAVRALALDLGAGLSAAVPRASLATEAFALASGAAIALRRDREEAPGPQATLSVAAMAGRALAPLIDTILHFAPSAATGHDGPEPVHQMRVAVRRARSVLAAFRDVMDGAARDRLDAGLRTLAGRLGPTRDWDVFVTETAPAIAAAIPDDPRFGRLVAAAERKRREHHAALRSYLGGAEFRLLLIEMAWLAAARNDPAPDDPAPRATPLPDFAAAVLNRRLKRLLAAGKAIESLDIPALHDLRLRVKRARYTAEIFAPLYPGKPVRRFIRRLSTLQQSLGLLNDQAVAEQLLGELGGPTGRHAHASGLVLGFAAARAAGTRARIARTWERFRRRPPFWT